MPNLKLNPDVRTKVVSYVQDRFSEELSRLYPCRKIEDLIGELSNDDLTAIAVDETPLMGIVKMIGTPEIKSVYWQIFHNYPELSEMYPDANVFELPQNQLEMLARGVPLKEVLGKPVKELDIISRQNPNPMDPPARKRVDYLRPASPKQAFLGGGNRVNVKESNDGTYRGRSGK